MSINVRLSGAMCGKIWMPAVQSGLPINVNISRERERFTSHATIAETLQHVLTEKGRDFQCPMFTADTQIIFEYRRNIGAGRYIYAVRTYDLANCPSLTDIVDAECYTSDFMGAA